VGYLQGKLVVVVTMRGREFGKVRKAALMPRSSGGLTPSSPEAATPAPSWYCNIVAAPSPLRDSTVVQDMRARSGAPATVVDPQ
jgi:hypothetical protein